MSWIRSSFCSAMSRFRPRSSTLDRGSVSGRQSMIGLALSPVHNEQLFPKKPFLTGKPRVYERTGFSGMEYDLDKVDEMVLALLWLTPAGNRRAWSLTIGTRWSDSYQGVHLRSESRAKSVVFSEDGERRAQELFERHFGREG